jgi:hypothetical protein
MTHSKDTTRRTFLSTAAALAASAAITIPAGAIEADPIFAAIEAHKAAKAAFFAIVSAHSDLETLLPSDKRRSNIDAHGETIVETDDPRWIASERDVKQIAPGPGCGFVDDHRAKIEQWAGRLLICAGRRDISFHIPSFPS